MNQMATKHTTHAMVLLSVLFLARPAMGVGGAGQEAPVWVSQLVEGWRVAWQRSARIKNIRELEAFYHTAFYHPDARMRKRAYMARLLQGAKRFSWFQIRVTKLRVLQLSATLITVQFQQYYARPGYADEGRKTLAWQKERGRWRIAQENWRPLPLLSTQAKKVSPQGDPCARYRVGQEVTIRGAIFAVDKDAKDKERNSRAENFGRILRIRGAQALVAYKYSWEKVLPKAHLRAKQEWFHCTFRRAGEKYIVGLHPNACTRYRKGQRVKVSLDAPCSHGDDTQAVGAILQIKGRSTRVRYSASRCCGKCQIITESAWFQCQPFRFYPGRIQGPAQP